MKIKWSKKTPTEEGWYWIKYGSGTSFVKCPCRVVHVKEASLVYSALGPFFIEGPNHGGKGLKNGQGKRVNTIRFGPRLTTPE
jgi:hypothetical protein